MKWTCQLKSEEKEAVSIEKLREKRVSVEK